jgi:hypothetical protein
MNILSYSPYKIPIAYRKFSTGAWEFYGYTSSVGVESQLARFLDRPDSFRIVLQPMSYFDKFVKEQFYNKDNGIHHDEEVVSLFCEENIGACENISDLDYRKMPYECVDYMLRNWIDFMGLIGGVNYVIEDGLVFFEDN